MTVVCFVVVVQPDYNFPVARHRSQRLSRALHNVRQAAQVNFSREELKRKNYWIPKYSKVTIAYSQVILGKSIHRQDHLLPRRFSKNKHAKHLLEKNAVVIGAFRLWCIRAR